MSASMDAGSGAGFVALGEGAGWTGVVGDRLSGDGAAVVLAYAVRDPALLASGGLGVAVQAPSSRPAVSPARRTREVRTPPVSPEIRQGWWRRPRGRSRPAAAATARGAAPARDRPGPAGRPTGSGGPRRRGRRGRPTAL